MKQVEERPVLALDVPLKNLGWCVFDGDEIVAAGTVQTKPPKGAAKYVALEAAARGLSSELLSLISRFSPAEVVAEMPLEGSKSMNAVQAMRLAAGVVIGTCAGAGLTLHTTRPRDGKIAFLGAGKGEKDDMIDAAKRRWPSAPWPKAKCRLEHAADAAAAYLAWKQKDE
ncbi:hypothetical protein GM415_15505 [Pseudodesulfovibrio cashew]|uniref:Uncharacterized protein n=1 Tax=Pseudodesulfovibrio cashew TaxID=2678688 RepID=A0A6I6JMI4_9BACT|nr:hypothetical protein [Pseudodesulfovibrio cashew]QGY41462.1 hypothetical protein GM415_15505 [Pseudodesulfovibrio cashew]